MDPTSIAVMVLVVSFVVYAAGTVFQMMIGEGFSAYTAGHWTATIVLIILVMILVPVVL